MLPGDQLWEIAPPNKNAIQIWGIALVRDGAVIATLIDAVG